MVVQLAVFNNMANRINLILIPVILVLLVSINKCSSKDVYLSESSTNSDCSDTASDNPCNNLIDALNYTISSTTLTIYPGSYNLLSSYTFSGVSDISITADHDASAVISCSETENDTGIAFISSKNITIRGITFIGCGMKQNSTTRNFTDENKLVLVDVVSTLYFESCELVTLTSVVITESRGVAIQMYSTNGTVEISNSSFTNNRGCNQSSNDSGDHCNNVTDSNTWWGGGVYIEFPFCVPGDNSCSQQNISSVDFHFVSNSNYIISDCIFDGNIAHDPMEQRLVLPYHSYHKATGSGGGLSIFFKGNASNNVIAIERCSFRKNTAIYGGGAYVEMQDSAYSNIVTVTDSVFTNNTAVLEGGGMFVSYLFLNQHANTDVVKAGNITLQSLQFIDNTVDIHNGKGGAISYTTTRQPNSEDESSNKFSIYDCNFTNNTGFIGSAAKISAYAIEDNGYLHPVTMSNIVIFNNTNHDDAYISITKPFGSGALYVSDVPIHFSGSLRFTSNSDTALAAYHSKMTTAEKTNMNFTSNSGYDGGALSLQSSSVLVLNESVSLNFTSNTALNKGGAIFASYDNPSTSIETQGCFIQYSNVTVDPNDWAVKVKFVDDRAKNESNSIYATSLLPCVLGRPFGVLKDMETKLKKVLCWNGKWFYNRESESCNKHILTDIGKFIKKSSPLEVVPGKITQMGVTAVDEQGDEIPFSITVHAYSKTKDVRVDSDYAYISNDQIKLKNFNIKQNTTVWIQLDTVGQQQKKQTTIEVRLKNCPPGYHLDTELGVCVCSGTFGSVLKCNESTMTASLLSGYWIGYTNCSDEVVVTHCRQSCDYSKAKGGYYELGSNFSSVQNTCKKNSHGQICSLCDTDYKPSMDSDSFECIKCNKWYHITIGVILFVLFDIVFPIAFIVAIRVADVPLTSGLLHGPIFFAQMITSIVSLDADDVIQYKDLGPGAGVFSDVFEKFYTSAYDVFNLEFLMFIQKYWCLGWSRLYQVVAIRFITGFIPMLMVILFWVFYRCYDRRSRSNTESKMKLYIRKYAKGLPNLFATCILLSYTKVAVTLCFLLTPISLVTANGKYGEYSHSVLYVDGSVCYPDYRLLSLLVVAVIFLIPIPLLLIFFRYKKDSESFFGRVLYQFQSEFRKGRNEFEAIHGNGNYSCTGKQSTPGAAYCDPCHMCCGIEIDSKTEYEYECCTSAYVCRYYQKRSRCCPCSINTSFDLLDFRWLSGFMFILRIIMILPFLLAWTTIIRFTLQLAICMFAGVLILVIKPYKRSIYKYIDCNRVEAFSFFNLAFILALCIYQYHYTTTEGLKLSLWGYVLQVLLVMVPLLWIVVVYCVLVRKKWSHVSCKCFRYCCSKPDRVDERERLRDPADQVVRSESYQLRDRSGEESDNGAAPTVRISAGRRGRGYSSVGVTRPQSTIVATSANL